ncbi:MAG TPA: transglutaminase family protein [Rhodopila sp.]|nr:transglutaminase family protein [Rhodopila sp.]
MRYRVRHSTRYAYGSPVELAAHMVHLRPRSRPGQNVISERIISVPTAARRQDRRDHFGNHVTWLFLDLPHADFEVVSEAIVDVSGPPVPAAGATPAWQDVARAARGRDAWQAVEFTFPSRLAQLDAAATAYATESFPAGRPVLDGVLALNDRIYRDFRFRSGVTGIHTTVAQVMQRREGVCQDFTHVMISALRGLGLPARYTSGYIRTHPPPGQKRRIGADQSHAWVGCWLGPAHGWVEVDPTNGIVVAQEHVLLGWGRDFADVSPVRGVILGGGEHSVSVAVDLEPIGDDTG